MRLQILARERRHDVAGHMPPLANRMLRRRRLVASIGFGYQRAIADGLQRPIAPHLKILVYGVMAGPPLFSSGAADSGGSGEELAGLRLRLATQNWVALSP